jgi:uncharacterized protein (DUF2249 family)
MATAFRELDVRPILRDGGEPFQVIMENVQALKPGEGLRLFATFRPQPLFKVMATRGYDHAVIEIAGGDFEVLFTPRPGAAVAASEEAADSALWPDPIVTLDLTDLDPPEPMVRILARLEGMAKGEVLFALLAREPVFLFPELTHRGHQWAGNLDATGSVFRIMIRAGQSAK